MDFFWLLAFAVGIGTSLIELLSRYRDDPFTVIATSLWAWVYLLLNGTMAIAAYFILLTSAYGDLEAQPAGVSLAFVAGLSAAVVLRSRVFTAHVGDEQISIGPGYVIDQLLNVIDAQIDRQRALQRVQIVVAVMKGKDFDGAKTHASTMITGSRQNLTLQAQQDLANQIREVADRKIPNQERSYALGFILLDFMGESFLRAVAKHLPEVPLGEDEAMVVEANGTELIVKTSELTNTGKIVQRNWGASMPVDRADLVQELLRGVELPKLNARIDQLMARGELGHSESERMALRYEIDRVLNREDTTEEDKVFGLGFVVHQNIDRRRFREMFDGMATPASERRRGRATAAESQLGPRPDGLRHEQSSASRKKAGTGKHEALREDSNADRPITGRHPTIGAPAGPMPAASTVEGSVSESMVDGAAAETTTRGRAGRSTTRGRRRRRTEESSEDAGSSASTTAGGRTH
ncbi:hypothetical protein PPSIR1_07400 [Plesiocystis pacifica SIR-1]|uniref:Uncharacterized protein n=1 Tax=Plesiocystis pacifica SIR-1 TaxID=391625 RepID=A6GCM1_9BACT|nr:hypothetical protein [Plesiocystis pacifica]EDM76373.1 hypothetical protein PPSIR1_07400 [Plesiocystis pacifica SIR-1]